MSKIKILATLKSQNQTHTFEGKGLKRNNQIIYQDNNIQTKITVGNIITIERKADYHLKINLKKGIKQSGTYITNYGTINLETITTELIQTNKELKITYKLKVNDTDIDTFTYNLKFTLDT